MSDQLLHRPGVQGLATGLERDQVVGPEPAQPVGQPAGKPPPAAADDDHVEKLLLDRQVALDLDHEWGAGEEVGEQQAEQAVPVPQRLLLVGHWTIPPEGRRRPGAW